MHRVTVKHSNFNGRFDDLLQWLVKQDLLEISSEIQTSLFTFYQQGADITKEDFEKVQQFIKQIQLKPSPDTTQTVVKLLNTPGGNDYFTLLLIGRLVELKMDLEIISSEQDALLRHRNELEQSTYSSLSDVEPESLSLQRALSKFSNTGSITAEIAEQIILRYQSCLKLLSCSVGQDSATLFSHAAITPQMIQQTAHKLEIQYDVSTPEALQNTIAALNRNFYEFLTKDDEKSPFEESPFLNLIRSEDISDIDFIKHYTDKKDNDVAQSYLSIISNTDLTQFSQVTQRATLSHKRDFKKTIEEQAKSLLDEISYPIEFIHCNLDSTQLCHHLMNIETWFENMEKIQNTATLTSNPASFSDQQLDSSVDSKMETDLSQNKKIIGYALIFMGTLAIAAAITVLTAAIIAATGGSALPFFILPLMELTIPEIIGYSALFAVGASATFLVGDHLSKPSHNLSKFGTFSEPEPPKEESSSRLTTPTIVQDPKNARDPCRGGFSYIH